MGSGAIVQAPFKSLVRARPSVRLMGLVGRGAEKHQVFVALPDHVARAGGG